MIVDDQLLMAVIYHNPSDFPGMYVGRYHRILGGNILIDDEPFAVASGLEEIRRAIAPGNNHQIGAQATDDPCIVEVWV